MNHQFLPDFLQKIGIEKVSDNLPEQVSLKISPEHLARLFGTDFLKIVQNKASTTIMQERTENGKDIHGRTDDSVH